MKKEKTLKEEAVEVTEAYGKAMSAYFARLKSLKGDDEEASLNRIVDVDHQLESFLERVQAHQKLVAECAAIDSQLSQIDGWVLESIRQLIEAEQATSQWLFDVRRRQSASASSVNDYEDVLYLAARMAPTTFAPPPNWAPPQPLGLHRPPNPQVSSLPTPVDPSCLSNCLSVCVHLI